MPVNKARRNSSRKALKDLSNVVSDTNGRNLAKSVNASKKLYDTMKDMEEEKIMDDSLDRLLLVQSDLSVALRQIDELVAQAIDFEATNQEGKKEIESFSVFLSGMLSSLKPWVPRLKKVLSSDPEQTQTHVGHSTGGTISFMNDSEQFEVESPEHTGFDSLISPSPLVSWRGNNNVDRGRLQGLFTPLPLSNAPTMKHKNLSASEFESIASCYVSNLNISKEANYLSPEDEVIEPTVSKPFAFAAATPDNVLKTGFVSSSVLQKNDQSVLMTPCLKTSPPRSCIVLEPPSECHRGKVGIRKSTPFPVGAHYSSDSELSDSSGSRISGGSALKYQELLEIQQVGKSGVTKRDIDSSPVWSFSPPKTCVLMKPPSENPDEKAGNNLSLPIFQQENKSLFGQCVIKEPFGGGLPIVESTPLWKEPESRLRTGKRAGETTLKRELWTRFEAASTVEPSPNVPAILGTSKKGFLDMLDEVSCEEESSMPDNKQCS